MRFSGAYYGPGTILSVLYKLSHLILTTNLRDRYYHYVYLYMRKMRALEKLVKVYKFPQLKTSRGRVVISCVANIHSGWASDLMDRS